MTLQVPVCIPGAVETVHCPDDWNPRVQKIVDRGATVYGPKWDPSVVELLRRMSTACVDGYSVAAYDSLLRAEAKLGLVVLGAA